MNDLGNLQWETTTPIFFSTGTLLIENLNIKLLKNVFTGIANRRGWEEIERFERLFKNLLCKRELDSLFLLERFGKNPNRLS